MRSYLTDTAAPTEGRLFSPVFERNAPPIIAALVPILGNCTGTVLEIGSGSGQHAGAFQLAFPSLTWQPSDPAPEHRASIAAWRAHLRLPERAALDIDAGADWAQIAPGPLDAIVSMNVIHIAPLAVLRGILSGAAKTLASNGQLIFYGPFKEDGVHTGDGNRAFDERLRGENPDWGIRDLDEVFGIAAEHGLIRDKVVTMPANNRLVVLERG